MIKLFSSPRQWEINLLKNLMEENGIRCSLRNEGVRIATGEAPWIDAWPELWILDDANLPEAQRLLDEHQAAQTADAQTAAEWTCPQCGESVEGTFELCWNCSAAKPREP